MHAQLMLDGITDELEDPRFLSEQIITYLGNKRSLLKAIERTVLRIRRQLGGRRLASADIFSGSGIVSRMLKKHSDVIYSNDFESYAALIGKAYLTNYEEINYNEIAETVRNLNHVVNDGHGPSGFIAELYAPEDDKNILAGERVFYTRANAQRLDAYAQLIHSQPQHLQHLLMAPLLSAASVHANTGGVFKGFYKDANGVGKYGGAGADALSRITAPIELKPIVLSKFNSQSHVFQLDAKDFNQNIVDGLDLAYLDPPYNQHPYGSNYFMLNLLVSYKKPSDVSDVSGIPPNWQRSIFNRKKESFAALTSLIHDLRTRFVLLSFNNEGFLTRESIQEMMSNFGKVEVIEVDYTAYRASRNLNKRTTKVLEYLFLLDKAA